MTLEQGILLAGFIISTILSAGTMFKLIWGGAASHQSQFNALDKACEQSVLAVRNEMLAKFEGQSVNIGNVVANIGNRIHDLELQAANARATAAETYMRRDSYHKATDEFKRDVRDAHADLKQDMDAGFDKIERQLDAMSQAIEAGRLARASGIGA